MRFSPPSFAPHRLLPGGHAQTLAGAFLPGDVGVYGAVRRDVDLSDGDRLALHDDQPAGWRAGDPVALLMHGLGGSHASPYMARVARKLGSQGVRAFRMDLRGGGAGMALAKGIYHSGRSADAAAAIEYLGRLCPHSPVTLVGFSLGGNIAIKLAGEVGHRPPGELAAVMGVCAPVDLPACSSALSKPINRLYDRYFVRLLLAHLKERSRLRPDAATRDFPRPPRRLVEFDEHFTAPLNGFQGAADYYGRVSAKNVLADVELPTLILASADDPMIPIESVLATNRSPAVELHVASGGGHLGFLGRPGSDPDLRWSDWRVVEWALQAGR